MSGPRFVVTELVGTRINGRSDGRGNAPAASYYVQDTHNMWKVIATVENRSFGSKQSRAWLRLHAERKARRLNAWHEAEMARG